jgi:ornithine cyclodeaminase/alanine dehydrogenase-like protein (mu-crystallin family)
VQYLTDKQVADILENKWHSVVEAIEEAFVDPTADMVPKVYLDGEGGDFRAMPAALKTYAALKWIGVFPNNWQIPVPTTNGSLILSDRHTGVPLVGMDCTTLTAYRTAASSAIAAKYCAPDATELAFIGCGLQAKYHIEAYETVYGLNMMIELFDKKERAMKELHNWIGDQNIARSWGQNKSIKETVKNAELITTLTPSTEAYLDVLDIPNHCHINSVGADSAGKRELMTNVIDGAADIICDDPIQALHSGELQYNEWPNLEVNSIKYLIKNHKTMQLNKGISIFDSTGVAIEDIAIGILIWKEYNKLGQ